MCRRVYIARNLPTEFSESTYIAIAMGSFLEVVALGIPLLFIASSDPSTRYLIRSVLAIATSLCPLLPIFLPKYFQRNVNRRYHDAVVAQTGNAPVQSRVTVRIGSTSKLFTNKRFYVSGQPTANENDSHVDDILAPGTTKVRRNTAFWKEQQASSILKASGIGSRPFLRTSGWSDIHSARETTIYSTERETISSRGPAD